MKSESAKATNLKIEDKYFFSQRNEPENHESSAFHQVVEETSALIACYDCGGQPEFFDVMPALITAPTGYVMVFDMSKDIMNKTYKSIEFYKNGEKYLAENKALYANAELLKSALAT